VDSDWLWVLGLVTQFLGMLFLVADLSRSKSWANDLELSLGKQWGMALRDRGFQGLILLLVSAFIIFVLQHGIASR
jgi:hypothetical protein